ncbi:MAG: response regulator [Candidatus Acidiferrales bacterium]
MQFHRETSIRQKLTRIVMLTCGIAILAACSVFAAYDVTTYRRTMASDLSTVAEIVGGNTAVALTFNDPESAHETLNSLRAKPHVVEACIYGPDGRIFARYSRPGSKPDFIPPARAGEGISIISGHLVLFRQIRSQGEAAGTIYLKSDLGQLYARAEGFLGITAVIILACLLLTYLLASRLQRVISGPILELARTAFTVSNTKDYSLRATKKSEDETGYLYDCFNGMLAQIQHRDTELLWARDELEVRVDERTRELQNEVSVRALAERKLAERTAFLNSLIENCPVALLALDPDERVQTCNPAFEQIFGFRAQEVLGHSLANLITVPEQASEVETLNREMLSGRTLHMVTQHRRKEGTLVEVEVFSVPLVLEGKLTGILRLYQDITERKKAEGALLRAKDAAEATTRAKSEFLANMSHEIRTPMNGIIGMTGLALDTELTSEQREYLTMVKTSADSLLKLINDILDFSKIEAGRFDLEAIDFALRQSVGETLKTLGLRAHEKGVELAWRVGADVPEFLSGDLSRLRQIVVNLIGNALKFTERGEVVLEVEKEDAADEALLLHFKVKDTGIGIAPEKQKLIFDAFTQADGSTTRKYGGTGLGLAITSQIVELMGGKIWLESELGRGSTFHFTARFGIAKGNSVKHAAADPQLLSDSLVLIVDDNITNRIILTDTLMKWGMQVDAAESAEAALAILNHAAQSFRPFSVIITDLNMPLVDGFGLVEAIRENPVLAAIPILMISSSAQPSQRARSEELGIAAFLTKPVQPSELLDAVLNVRTAGAIEDTASEPPVHAQHGEGERMKVLLTEDNAVNRILALKLLEKHGHTVVLAENGREALEALEREAVDLILMDVQMPVMDGLEAIAAIRKKEEGSGVHLPIVALTAHAMKGDRERCLAAGADEYLTKPIKTPELMAAIERFQGAKASKDPQRVLPGTPDADSPVSSLDMADALERVEGDSELLEEISRIFAEECLKTMAALRRAVEASDTAAVGRLAHTLKGSASNVGARILAQTTAELESMARAGDLRGAQRQFKTVESEVSKLLVEMEKISRKVTL